MALVPAPAVIVPPAETVQVYPVMPEAVEYTFPVDGAQEVVAPVMAGNGKGFTVIVNVLAVPVQDEPPCTKLPKE